MSMQPIRICPDWNVKWYNYASSADNNTLEYVQIGM